jgi:hypothetical protein
MRKEGEGQEEGVRQTGGRREADRRKEGRRQEEEGRQTGGR